MLPLASSFTFFLCNSVVSVLGGIIIHFLRYVCYIYRTLFNSESNSRIQVDYGTRAMDVGSVLAIQGNETTPEPPAETVSVLPNSNSSKFQFEPTTQIHGFVEQSQAINCFVQQMYCTSRSSGNRTPDGFEFSSGKEESKCFKRFETLPEVQTLGEDCSFSLSDSDSESRSFDDGFIEIELEPQLPVSNAKALAVNDWNEEENEDGLGESKETEWDEKEHQDLIYQLKMELRNSRTGGLPTVLEEEAEAEPESMCPKSVEALKPLKNGGDFEQKEHFKEIHELYKTYADKMRKLDILNTQTNYAIGFVKLKDPISPIDGRKSGLKSLLSHKLRPGRAYRGSPKLMRDFKRDMEMVYVGHLCLSWELLHWQHRKAIQLQQNDSEYSQVVNKFQLFCILIQRFIEDERFCGPRIENYSKNRLLIRSLLQVPAIREDCVNDKNLSGKEGESTISTAALVSIIEDSIQVFREFLQTDKDIGNSAIKFKCPQEHLHHIDTQNPSDAQLMMMQVRTDLRKKEKRLKDITRSGNCIVKKLQRINEEGRARNELLIAEVELRLVSRVVSMSRLTESQLIWCHKKLHQVNFVNGKVALEPSFLLFPC